MEDLRHCRVCKWVKPVKEFYPRQCYECKECTKARVKAHRLAHPEQFQKYEKSRQSTPKRLELRRKYAQTPRGKESKARSTRRYRELFPQRSAAHIALGNAVRDGRVIPWPCMICGEKAEAHHPDYSMPLDVVWLCNSHHRQAHALVK